MKEKILQIFEKEAIAIRNIPVDDIFEKATELIYKPVHLQYFFIPVKPSMATLELSRKMM